MSTPTLEVTPTNFKVTFPYDEYMIMKARQVPGGKWSKRQNAWLFPLSRGTYWELKETLGISDPETERRMLPCPILWSGKDSGLYEHQKDAAKFVFEQFGLLPLLPEKHSLGLITQPISIPAGAALFLEMGCGKTFTSINIIETLHLNRLVNTVVVVAPLSIVNTWQQEIEKHGTEHMALSIPVVGTKPKRIKALTGAFRCQTPLKIFLINPEGLKTVQKEISALNPELVIVDESTLMKNRASSRAKIIKELYQNCLFKMILSGNPIPKGGDEIFSQYEWIEPAVFGSSYYKFREKYFELDFFNSIKGLFTHMKEEFEDKFHQVAFIARKDDCLDLPNKIYERASIEMNAEQKKIYKSMWNDAVVSYEDSTCCAAVVITKFLRCSQIAGGLLPLVNDADETAQIMRLQPNPKLEELVNQINLIPEGQQVVIWARFNEEIEMIEERLKEEGRNPVAFYGKTSYKDKLANREAFREGEATDFIGNPAAGGKGLNDLIGAQYVIYYSNDYSAENRQQSEDRNHRSGTKGSTVYVDLIMKNTIDEEVLAVLRGNKDFSDALLNRRLNL